MSEVLSCSGPLAGLSNDDRSRLLDRQSAEIESVGRSVTEFLGRVRVEGDAALREFARDFDGVEMDTLEVPGRTWQDAWSSLPSELRSALEQAAANIGAYHQAQLPAPVQIEVEPGVRLSRRTLPVRRAGVYAPGGRAAYPSSVLMGVIPARVAGVDEVIVCSPPGPDGVPPDAVLAAAYLAGADRVFAVGGAGAISAMAYGTESVPVVDVIVGPGNRYVNEAKRQVAGTVRIDGPAGPSELLVLVDETADAEQVAREVVAQAEHDPDACVGVVCVADDAVLPTLTGAVSNALARAARTAERRDIVLESLQSNGFLLWTSSRGAATEFANEYGAEHLTIISRDADGWADDIRNAGTIFVGPHSSVAFGDYMTGGNHVLPTGGRARSYSGLSVDTFLRTHTVQRVTSTAAARLGPPVALLAASEGLPGHAAAATGAAGATNIDGGPS